jgi:cephalosporin hydroxylase
VIFRIGLFRLRVALLERNSSIEKLVDLVFGCDDIGPIQIRSELIALLEAVQQERPRTVLEIGTARGGTLFLLSLVSGENATIISVDLPGGEFGGGYPAWKVPLYRAFAKRNQRIYLLRADSHSEVTLQQVRAILSGREVDFLLIDGDHTYEGVKRDYEFYSPLVGRSGTVAFHDIADHPPSTGCEVRRLWEEVKTSYQYREIIEDPNQLWAGIGLLRK